MSEGKIINMETTNQNQKTTSEAPQKRGDKKPWMTLAIILVVVAGAIIFNWRGEKDNKTEKEFPISREQIKSDFKNGEKKLKSEVTPPENYVERFKGPKEASLSAIESGVPSMPDFKDLSEDYLNIASVYSILGDYEQAEEWYIKTLEKYPESYKASLNLADLYILMGQYQSAGLQFYETATLFPKDGRAYAKMADFYHKYSMAEDRLIKAEAIYEWGVKKADDPKNIFSEYAFFLENYTKNYEKALEMERNYQLTSGEQKPEEIERLKALIDANNK